MKNLKTEEDRKSNLTIDEIFEKDCHVFILNKAYYGQIGSVVKVTEGGSILVNIKNETDILKISYDAAKSQTKWLQGWKMANNLGLTSYILSRMTGTLYLHGPGKNNSVLLCNDDVIMFYVMMAVFVLPNSDGIFHYVIVTAFFTT